jgi:hypothetical protein
MKKHDQNGVNKSKKLKSTTFHKRPYIKPNLKKLGDLRSMTLGGSGVDFDASGGTFTGFPG